MPAQHHVFPNSSAVAKQFSKPEENISSPAANSRKENPRTCLCVFFSKKKQISLTFSLWRLKQPFLVKRNNIFECTAGASQKEFLSGVNERTGNRGWKSQRGTDGN